MSDQPSPPPYDQQPGVPRMTTHAELEAERQRALARSRARRRGAIGGGLAAGAIVLGAGFAGWVGEPDEAGEHADLTCDRLAEDVVDGPLGESDGARPALLRLDQVRTTTDRRESWSDAEPDASGRRLVLVCRGTGVFDNGVQQRVEVQLHDVEGRDEEYLHLEPIGRPVPVDPDGDGRA